MTGTTLRCPSCGSVLTVTGEEAPPDDTLWRSAHAVAKATHQSFWTIRRLALGGQIPARRGSRDAILVRASDVKAWLSSMPVTTAMAVADRMSPDLLADAALRMRTRRNSRRPAARALEDNALGLVHARRARGELKTEIEKRTKKRKR